MPTPLGYAGRCGWIRRNLPRNCLKVSSGSKWTLTITRLCRPDCNIHQMITVLTSNHMCHNRLFRQKAPVNADSRSSPHSLCQVERYQRTEIAEPTREQSGDTHLFHAPPGDKCCCPRVLWDIWVQNSLFLCLEKTDPTRPLVFQAIHRTPSERKGPHPSHPVVRWKICGCAWRASCLQRERVEAEKHLVVVRCWELQEAAKICRNLILQKDQQANPRTWALPVSKWWLWSGAPWNKSCQYSSQTGSPVPIWTGCIEAIG